MIPVDEALRLILEQIKHLPTTRVSIQESLGSVLDEEVVSDINSPPHDKSIVDGFAVVVTDSEERTVIEEVAAGGVPSHAVTPGHATHVMTGAPIPEGADAVVMIERTEKLDDGRIRILDPTISVGQNIMLLGTSMTKGQVVLDQGAVIRPVEIGLLAEVGHTQVEVIPRPKVAILATGSELVKPSDIPTAGRLRNSNGPMLCAVAQNLNTTVLDLGMATDDRKILKEKIATGLEADILVTSGGVSAGVYDFVPQVFESLGIEKVFHKVSLKPGKPLWFGVRRGAQRDTLVFGLPGNPVSSFVCFELFVRPAINKLSGMRAEGLTKIKARLSTARQMKGNRTTYSPARVKWDSVLDDHDKRPIVEPVRWRGSGDLHAVSAANSLIIFPEGDHQFAAGEPVDVLLL